jgi:hypothetical protein
MTPVAPQARAADLGQLCAIRKAQAWGAYGSALVRCIKPSGTGLTEDQSCLARAASKVLSAFEKAEQTGGCPVVGDGPFFQSIMLGLINIKGPGLAPGSTADLVPTNMPVCPVGSFGVTNQGSVASVPSTVSFTNGCGQSAQATLPAIEPGQTVTINYGQYFAYFCKDTFSINLDIFNQVLEPHDNDYWAGRCIA